ncbi:hypothetical protein CYLTODRAFT_423607 [Cylindrobasidium torrendii FP15055 ss-10]|uniref:DNA polymerase n=1 Tax=Cylindrobasidium torrendii FP15055 ss-10 TaxID=1314674 RepID=A0A0D7B7Y9_9AGAR|nr:hypothetical protein CYLTODRAFT_423607 [Cylindrobasidium torrendii FP15055 ss-10]
MADADPVVRVQINQIDYVMQPPGKLDNCNFPKIPVIRIFGPSSLGKKCCLHVHQVYPYFFVEYLGEMGAENVRAYQQKLQSSLNSAILISLQRDNSKPSKNKFIRAILPVKGIHFYGFHSSYAPFFKVYVADPGLLSRAVTLLQSGTIMGTHFRVFESHLSYILQFLSDFGLYGCGWIDLGDVLQRTRDMDDDADGLEASPYHRQSRMDIELDVHAFHILNRHKLSARNLHHELRVPQPPLPDEPFVLGVRELWEDERRRREERGMPATPEMPIDPSASSRGEGGGWVAEARWWDRIRERIEREQDPTYVDERAPAWSKYIMSTFESIEALWEDEYKVWRPANDEQPSQSQATTDAPQGEAEVDAMMAASQVVAERLERDDKGWDKVEVFEDEYGDQQDEGDTFDEPAPKWKGKGKAQEEDDDPFAGEPTNGPLVINQVKNRTATFPTRTLSPSRQRAKASGAHPVAGSSRLSRVSSEGVAELSASQRSDTPTMFQAAHDPIIRANKNAYVYAEEPPILCELIDTMHLYDVPEKIYQAPYYSKLKDAPKRPREYGGVRYHLKGGTGVSSLPEWDSSLHYKPEGKVKKGEILAWEYASQPPSVRVVQQWLAEEEAQKATEKQAAKPQPRPFFDSQIEGPTQANIYHLKPTPPKPIDTRERQDMTIFSLEVFVPAPRDRLPDPERDEVAAVFYSFQVSETTPRHSGIIAVASREFDPHQIKDFRIEAVESELDLLNAVIDTVLELDPDILVGWNVQTASWSYLTARADGRNLNFSELVARATMETNKKGAVQWEKRKASTFHAAGRQILNVWRIIRSEVNLNIYTFENCVFHILRTRTPKYSTTTLTAWYHSAKPTNLGLLFRYFATRTAMVIDMLNSTEIVTKTAEFARVFGVDFYSVITRGSQFKVESFMFRIAKPESFVLLSPSRTDVGKQNAAECMPLILEPQSAFYTSPVIVLDFQSLYPSVMIAYNYCYSTCLGRAVDFQGRNKFGVTDLEVPKGLVERLEEHLTVSPNGMVFVKPEVRKGLLGRMLIELLDTRVMVKQAMKGVKDDKALRKILDARQLGLKFIANVTYGYTSATFSGRMPAVEIADSIVQTGRETLEKAIMFIDSTPKWGAKVVYGDTDSMFIHLQGKTKDQAFRIGQDIADAITAMNPAPIKLKFEKVYMGCVLMAKKRYVGFKYEHPDETEPVFDAKGIETVRRDGVPAQQKMVETCLKLLFRTQDLSQVKSYCRRSWLKLLTGKASPQDFIFAKEVKMGAYSENGVPPPGAVIAAKRSLLDVQDEVQWGERVPYIIARGPTGSRLVDRAMSPLEFLDNPHTGLDADYYITRVLIPPLERIFNLVGANVRQWFDEMPKIRHAERPPSPSKRRPSQVQLVNIDQHFTNAQCIMCGARALDGICKACRDDSEETMAGLLWKIQAIERRFMDAQRTCMSCARVSKANDIKCESMDCAWMFERRKAEVQLGQLVALKDAVDDLEDAGWKEIKQALDWEEEKRRPVKKAEKVVEVIDLTSD